MRDYRVPRSPFYELEPRGNGAAYLVLFVVVALLAGGYWYLVQRLDVVGQVRSQVPLAVKTTRAPVLVQATATPVPMRLTKLDWDVPDGHFYTQTNGRPTGESPMGFPVTNSNFIYFYNELLRLGGIDTLGYPLSSRFLWRGKMTQVFQGGVMQWGDRTGELEFVNVLSDLHDLGKDPWLQQRHGVPPPLNPSFDTGKTWDAIVRDRMRLLDADPKIKAFYQAESHALLLYGLPDSTAEDQGNRIAMRFQRTALYHWKQPLPGGKPDEVTVADSGAIAIEAGIFPNDLVAPVAPPVGTAPMEQVLVAPTATPAPAEAVPTATGIPAAQAPASSTAAPTAAATPMAQQTLRVGNTNGDGVFLRRTTRLDDRLRAWPDGTTLEALGETATGDGLGWVKVKDPAGNIGWVPNQFLVPGSSR